MDVSVVVFVTAAESAVPAKITGLLHEGAAAPLTTLTNWPGLQIVVRLLVPVAATAPTKVEPFEPQTSV
jgi:hypothetical protein